MYPHHRDWPKGTEFAVVNPDGRMYFSIKEPDRDQYSWFIMSKKGGSEWFQLDGYPNVDITKIGWRNTLRTRQQQIDIDNKK